MTPGAILSLISFFSMLSILSIGGSNSVVPEMGRHAVEVEHWLTATQFTDIFAISQAAPGPSNLIVALIGFKVAGFWGALVAQLAMILPAASLMLLVSRIWLASSGSRWHLALEHGLAPIAVGLIFAGGWTIAEGASLSTIGYLIAAGCTLLFWKSHVNPIPIMLAAGVLGWMRWI
jgi:chromate transporter